MAMNRADLILCLGARFDDRVTGRLDAFSPDSKKVHVDIDRSSVNKNVVVDLPVIGDVGSVMARMIALWKSKGHKKTDQTEWWSRIEGWRARRSLDCRPSGEDILPQPAIAALYEATTARNPIIMTAHNQPQMCAAPHFPSANLNKRCTMRGIG